MASRNFFGIAFAAAMSATKAGWPVGIPARCTIALSPYLPLLVNIANARSSVVPPTRAGGAIHTFSPRARPRRASRLQQAGEGILRRRGNQLKIYRRIRL